MKYLLFLFFGLSVACSSEVKPKNQPASETTVSAVESSNNTSELLTADKLSAHPWEIEIVLDNGKIDESDQWKGSTLVLSEDLTYTWNGSSISDKGTYNLKPDQSIIMLSSENPSKHSEWSVKQKANMMVWIGTPTYSHQSLQLKLIKKR